MAPVCSSSDSIHYLITAFDCGVCPHTVTNTMATCTNLQPSTEIRECRFNVQIVVCRVLGNTSETALERIGGMCKNTIVINFSSILLWHLYFEVPTISKLAVEPRFMSSNQTLHSLEGFSDSVCELYARL